MPHSKRVCRRSAREPGRNPRHNYQSQRVYLKMKRKLRITKASRKKNRGR